jgi:hypothetical protein
MQTHSSKKKKGTLMKNGAYNSEQPESSQLEQVPLKTTFS